MIDHKIVDFKNGSLCEHCQHSNLCKYVEQYENIRNKLIELTSSKTTKVSLSNHSLTNPKITTVNQEVPPELDLSNGIYLHMTCCNYKPNNVQRVDPFAPPFKK